jgi:hypothetical protein
MLGALPVTNVMQTLFRELKTAQVDQLKRLGRRFTDVIQTQPPASILQDGKTRCCDLFLHDFSRLRQPASAIVTQTGIRMHLLSESSEWKRYEQRRMGEKTSVRNDSTVIAKCEGWAKLSQKINRPHWPRFNESQIHEGNTKMNMKKSNETTTKLNMNMNKNLKVNMNRKMKKKIDMKENRNEVELEHE